MASLFKSRRRTLSLSAGGVLGEQRRWRTRRAVGAQGIVVDPAGVSCVGVIIRDLSDTGARIYTTNAKAIRDHSYLINMSAGKAYLISIVWLSATEIGLSFDSSFMLDGTTPDDLVHLRQIWLENA